jgi:phospholipid/cholesterol/gamma-HCH transport system permease protein
MLRRPTMRPEAKAEATARLSQVAPLVERAGTQRIMLGGRLLFAEARQIWDDVRSRVAPLVEGDHLDIDMSAVESVDGGTMALLVHIRGELSARGVDATFSGASKGVEALIRLYKGDVVHVPKRRGVEERLLAQIGRATLEFFGELRGALAFLGEMLLAALGLLKEPKTGNWREVWPTMERTGADAVPIVVLINFLVGLVMAFQGATQLKQFGANQYVADLVGLSVSRELGPLMTAIILCGRSGAAFAAQLGSMRVSEEIDALRTMGFGPMRYLVLPRAVALMLVLPILTLIGDLVGMLGGMIVGVGDLGLTVGGYLMETQRAVSAWDVLSGLAKSVVFALAITLISCQQGFATTGGAEGVGKRTTASVVSILFTLIIIDAGFTILFHMFSL